MLHSNTEIVVFLLNINCTLVNQKDGNEETPLHIAVKNCKINMIELLLSSSNVNINEINGTKQTPFHIACWKGQIEIIRLFLARKDLNFSAKDSNGVFFIFIIPH